MARTAAEALHAYRSHGDAEAFRELVIAYQDMVFGACLRVLRNHADAEDAAQDTFMRLALHAGEIRKGVGAWLHACAVNAAIDRRKAERARVERERIHAGQRRDAGTHPGTQDMMESLDLCITELDACERDLLVEHFFNGRSQAELAECFGLSRPTVRRRLERAVERVRRRLRRRGLGVPAVAILAVLGETVRAPQAVTIAVQKIGIAGVGVQAPTGLALAVSANWPFGLLLGGAVAATLAAAVIGPPAQSPPSVPQLAAGAVAAPIPVTDQESGTEVRRKPEKTATSGYLRFVSQGRQTLSVSVHFATVGMQARGEDPGVMRVSPGGIERLLDQVRPAPLREDGAGATLVVPFGPPRTGPETERPRATAPPVSARQEASPREDSGADSF